MQKKTLVSLLLGTAVTMSAVVAILQLGPSSDLTLPLLGSVPMFIPIALTAIALLLSIAVVCQKISSDDPFIAVVCEKISSDDPFSDFAFLQAPKMSEKAIDNIPKDSWFFSGLVARQLEGYEGEALSNRFAMKLAYELYAYRLKKENRSFQKDEQAEKKFYQQLFTNDPEYEQLRLEVQNLILKQEYPADLSLDDLKNIVLECNLIPTFEVTIMASGSIPNEFGAIGFEDPPQTFRSHIVKQIDQRKDVEQKAPQVVPADCVGTGLLVCEAELLEQHKPPYPKAQYQQTVQQLLEGLGKGQEMEYTSTGGCLTSPNERGLLVLTLLSAFQGVKMDQPTTWQKKSNHVLIDRLLNGMMNGDDRKKLPETINTYEKLTEFLNQNSVTYTVDQDHFVFKLTQEPTPDYLLKDIRSFIQGAFGETVEVQGIERQSSLNSGP